MMKRILLPLERGDDATDAVSFARSLAQRRKAEILLLRVEEWPITGSFGFGWAPSWRAGELQSLKATLEENEGVAATILSPEALPASSALRQARLRAASLIVVPYHPEHGLLRVLHGSAADRFLRESPIPVLAVPAAGPATLPAVSRILYPYENGEDAVSGLRHAIDFAQLFEASVTLQRLRTATPPEEGFLPSLLYRGKDDRSHDAQDPKSLEGRLLWILRRREVPSQVLPPVAQPARDIPSSVIQNGIDLVLLTRTYESERARMTLARHVLQDARVPVLLTPQEAPVSPFLDAGSRVRVGI